MLLYILFGCLMGLFIHFCIIFGTNLLTQGLVQIVVFFPISVFRRKGISNGVQTEWNLRERDFWNKRDPEDLQWTSRNQQGGHEARRRAPTLVGPLWLHRPTSSSYIYPCTPKPTRSTTKTNACSIGSSGHLVGPLLLFLCPIFFIYSKIILRKVSGHLELCRIGISDLLISDLEFKLPAFFLFMQIW